MAQSGFAVRNAMLYAQAQHHAAELSGLANVAQAVTAIREPRELFERLVESLAPLFDVQILGFLLYDETERILRAEAPFHGLLPRIVALYRTKIEVDSPGAALLLDDRVLLTANAASDDRWRDLGLRDVAVAASIQDAALVPLLSSGHMLGYLQVSNHRAGPREFSHDEVRLLHTAGSQTASIIDNTRLLWRSSEQLRRSDAMGNVTRLGVSAATVDAALSRVVDELVRLFGAQLGVILLLDEIRGQLRLHASSAFGVTPDQAATLPLPHG